MNEKIQITLSREDLLALRDLFQNPLSEDPDPRNEDHLAAEFRLRVWTEIHEKILGVTQIEEETPVPSCIRAIKETMRRFLPLLNLGDKSEVLDEMEKILWQEHIVSSIDGSVTSPEIPSIRLDHPFYPSKENQLQIQRAGLIHKEAPDGIIIEDPNTSVWAVFTGPRAQGHLSSFLIGWVSSKKSTELKNKAITGGSPPLTRSVTDHDGPVGEAQFERLAQD